MDKYTFLTDIEKNKLSLIADDEMLFNAVKKVICNHIYVNGVQMEGSKYDQNRNAFLSINVENFAGDYEKVGKRFDAMSTAMQLLENGAKDLLLFKTQIKAEEKKNKAR